METIDYNGTGDWSAEGIRRRYLAHARATRQAQVADFPSTTHEEGEVRRVYPVMEEVIRGIDRGDPACVELGVEFVESGHRQAFGRILHSNAARALRRASLTEAQVDRLRRRILAMLVAGQVPHEFKQYARLLRRIGLGGEWPAARARLDEANPHVMKYVRYFEGHAR